MDPLAPEEEVIWRALLRIVFCLPKALDEDLVRDAGVTLTEYTVLMNLSEAAGQQLRLTDLAASTGLSVSRISRLVDEFCERRYVTKRRSAVDGREAIAALSSDGLRTLERAYPAHLRSVRHWVVDYLGGEGKPKYPRLALPDMADSLSHTAHRTLPMRAGSHGRP
jgi:DNA-binding MarR family transcriptional regulator